MEGSFNKRLGQFLPGQPRRHANRVDPGALDLQIFCGLASYAAISCSRFWLLTYHHVCRPVAPFQACTCGSVHQAPCVVVLRPAVASLYFWSTLLLLLNTGRAPTKMCHIMVYLLLSWVLLSLFDFYLILLNLNTRGPCMFYIHVSASHTPARGPSMW